MKIGPNKQMDFDVSRITSIEPAVDPKHTRITSEGIVWNVHISLSEMSKIIEQAKVQADRRVRAGRHEGR